MKTAAALLFLLLSAPHRIHVDGFSVVGTPTTRAVRSDGMVGGTFTRDPNLHVAIPALFGTSIQDGMASTEYDELEGNHDAVPLTDTAHSSDKNDRREKADNNNDTKQLHNPTPALWSALTNNQNRKGKSLVMAALVALSLSVSPLPSNAAMSGGRMGGSHASMPSSRSSYSRSYSSSPSSRSSYSRSYSSSPSYRSRPSSSYGSGFASGFGAGVGASVLTQPSYSYGYGYSPFRSPLYYGGGPGVVAYRSGPNLLPLLLTGGLLWTASQALQRNRLELPGLWNDGDNDDGGFDWMDGGGGSSALGPGVSVVKVSVAMDVSNRDDRNSILNILNRISAKAKTDSRIGIQKLTSEVALELLRQKSTIVSGATEYKHYNNRGRAFREYNNQSIQERSKFETETVNNFGGVDYTFGEQRGWLASPSKPSSKATMAVVTFLLAIDGDSTKVPAIQNARDVETALRRIAADSTVDDCLQNVEILWTPQDSEETLTRKDVLADYPELRSI